MRKGGLSAPKYYKRLSGSKNASKPEVSCFYCANAARNDLYGCALNVCKARSTVFRLTLFRATHNCASARPYGGVRICVPSSTVSNHDAWGAGIWTHYPSECQDSPYHCCVKNHLKSNVINGLEETAVCRKI